MPLNFQKPVRPKPSAGGLVVLHSDDGRIFDFTHFLPVIRRTIRKNDQFRAKNNAIFNPAVNAGYMVTGGKERQYDFTVMNKEQLKEIQDNGGEILSHCKYHVYLDRLSVAKPISAGADTIYHTLQAQRVKEGLTFFIEEGTKKETFTVTQISPSSSENWMKISPALTNSYTTAARVSATTETVNELLQGNVDLLASMGITCKHHINPWYSSSNDVSKPVLQQVFESVITHEGTFDKNNFDFHDIRRTPDIRALSFSAIDTWLTNAKNANSVVFFQSHGGTTQAEKDKFEYIINKSYELGLRIVRHSEAIDFLKNKK